MPISTGLQKQDDLQKKETVFLDGDELRSWGFIRDRIESAKRQRELAYPEFNDLTYLTDYNANQQISHSYLRGRLNDGEVRLNTGTVEKKLMTVMNEMMGLNMGVELRAFDDDDKEISELGDDMSDIVRRTNQWEKDTDMWPMMLLQLLSQRGMYIEEYFEERTVTDKKRESWRKGRVHQTRYSKTTQTISRPRKRLVDGVKVFLGDITIPSYRFDEQPYVVTYDVMNYKTAETIFGDWERWKYVKSGQPDSDWYNGRFQWRFANVDGINDVEVIRYRSFPDDEYQVIINGVPMFAPGEPLPWEWEGYNMKMFTYRDVADNFAYGQTFMTNARMIGLLKDEMLRNVIRKFRQAVEPPIGVRGRRVLSRDIWQEGAVTQGVTADDYTRLIDHDGVTPSEFQMINMVAQQIQEEMGVTNMMQGTEDKKLTATQSSQQMQQAIKALGFAVLAWSKVIRDTAYLRLYNVLENCTQPTGKTLRDGKVEKVYRSFSIEDATIGDNKGKKIVQFMGRDLEPDEAQEIYNYEEEQAKEGNTIRIKTINVEKMREIPIHWFFVVTPKEQETSALQRVMFEDKIRQAVQIGQITQRQVNPDKIIDEFERSWKVRGFFQEAPPTGGDQEGLDGVASMLGIKPGQTEQAAQMKQGQTAQTRKPGVQQVMGAPGGPTDNVNV